MARQVVRKLTEDAKLFVIGQLAAWEPPSAVAAAVNQTFGVSVSPQSVEKYDPTKVAGSKLPERYQILFEAARKRFIEAIDDVPEAHRAVRVRMLAKQARKADDRGNAGMMAQLLEQIAKEVGDCFTNRKELTGKGGGPIQIESLSDKDLDARIAQLSGEA